MNISFKSIIIKSKNLFPYLLLILIYFFFINIEANNKKNTKDNKIQNVEIIKIDKSIVHETNQRIKIPVVPYEQ